MGAGMLNGPKILHLAETPLVGAPGKIAAALNAYTGYSALSIALDDYPNALKGLFLSGTILVNSESSKSVLVEAIARADLIHVHNSIPVNAVNMIHQLAQSRCKFVYQAHSTTGEGPLFYRRADSLGLDFEAKLTIPHFPHLSLPDYTLVPNLIMEKASGPEVLESIPRILFSPSHKRTGQRWGEKVSPQLEEVLGAVESLKMGKIFRAEGVPPLELFQARRCSHITIDEIRTGAYHQVSLEGLAAGNVVVNGAEFMQTRTLQALCRTNDEVPFYRVTTDDVHESLPNLLRNPAEIKRYQRRSADFFQAHLRPEKLIQHFVRVYEHLGVQ